jgi:hypothetical protein
MRKASIVVLCRTGALCAALGLALFACKKEEPPPPLPAPKPAAPVAEAPLELKPEDAGAPVENAATKPKSAAVHKASGLTACCTALRQNAASAPDPTKGYMLYAAGLCDMAAAQGKDKSSAVGMLQSALKGAGLPTDCK